MALTLSCDCSAVGITVAGQPVARAYCHSATCREFYGVTVLAATAWPQDRLDIVAGADSIAEYPHPTKRMRRSFCTRCGTVLFGTNRLGMIVIKNSTVARSQGGRLAPELQPQLHLFYGAREIDVHDALPKYIEGRDGALFTE